jgi:hypothetical protein
MSGGIEQAGQDGQYCGYEIHQRLSMARYKSRH